MFLHQKMNFLIIFTILLLSKTRAQNNNNNIACLNRCGDQILEYPFGFSDDCGIKLNCINNKPRVGEFLIQNLTKTSILIYLPAKCNRTMQSIQPLFSDNFAPTRNNSFLVQDCSAAPLGGCVIPVSSFVENQIEHESCNNKNSNISCFTQQPHEDDVDVLSYEELTQSTCNYLISSIAVERSKEISLQFQAIVIELGWWVKGSCECSKNATCSRVHLGGNGFGFRCECVSGFRGDGFANSIGCQRDQVVKLENSGDEDDVENGWFYFVIALGFATGLWGVIGTLCVKKNWRHTYFRWVEDVADKIYVKWKLKYKS